ncbi:MAG: hypothetical protein QOJ29_384 [Thermoleophilaceae bacterium]|nr:hypothetical protein [Thermoleophilaceae bacterium]
MAASMRNPPSRSAPRRAPRSPRLAAAERSRRDGLLAAAAASMAEGLVALDGDSNIVLVNTAAEQILGYSQEQLVGRHAHSALHDQPPGAALHRAEACPLIVPEDGARPRTDDDLFVRSDGSLVPVGHSCSPLEVDGILRGTAIVFRDATIQQAAETAHDDAAREHEVLKGVVINGKSELRKALSGLTVANAELVRRLSKAVEFRDEDTGAHTQRIGRLAGALADAAGLDADFCERIRLAATLHDVGKVAVPDAVLLKPGKLDAAERTIIEQHAEQGYRLLRGSASLLLDLAASIAWTHHERWDGAGYPRGLAAEEIPVEGRLVAIADVFDALSNDRVYRKAFPLEKVLEIMREGRGTHFDPHLLDAFLAQAQATREEVAHEPHTGGADLTRRAYLGALRRGDAIEAEHVALQALTSGMPIGTLHAQVLTPAMRAIGELWEGHEMTVAGEHLATGITQHVLASVYQRSASITAAHQQRVLLAGVAGDHHTLGLQMIADQLEAAAYSVTNAGGDVDTATLIEAVRQNHPALVGLAVTLPSAAPAMTAAVRALRSTFPKLPIMLGGAAVQHNLAGPGVMVITSAEDILPAVKRLMHRHAGSVPTARG